MVVVLLVIAGVLLLVNLDNGYLWEDEAETALLARNTVTFGYPTAFDGRNLIEQPLGYGPNHAWIYAPWLPFYLLAGVFALVGESTWSARLPFALMGWLSIVLTWALARRLTDERRIHRLSVALLVCSVPFLLHMRQCRYYAMTTLLLLGVCVAYLAFCARPSFRRSAGLGALLLCLFHTNFGTCLPTVAALCAHQGVWGERATRVRLALVCAAVIGLTVPWALFFYRGGFIGAWSFPRAMDHLEYYMRVTNKYLVPLAAMAVLSVGHWLRVLRGRVTPAATHRAPGDTASARWCSPPSPDPRGGRPPPRPASGGRGAPDDCARALRGDPGVQRGRRDRRNGGGGHALPARRRRHPRGDHRG